MLGLPPGFENNGRHTFARATCLPSTLKTELTPWTCDVYPPLLLHSDEQDVNIKDSNAFAPWPWPSDDQNITIHDIHASIPLRPDDKDANIRAMTASMVLSRPCFKFDGTVMFGQYI